MSLAIGEDGLMGSLVPGAIDPNQYSSKAAAALGQEDAAGRISGDEPAAAAGEAPPAGTGLWMLPDEEVQLVLSRKREHLTPGLVSPEGIEAFEAMACSFDRYQDWMRRNYEANGGVVLVDGEFVARREEHYRCVEEELAAEAELGDPLEGLDFSYWNISDRLSDFYESDDGDEEDVQEANGNS